MIKEKLKQNLQLMDFAATIYNLFHRNNAWKYCSHNKIHTNGAFLNNVKFNIAGHNNSIQIGRMTRLKNCIITILGSQCEITIGGGSTVVSNVSLYCEDDKSRIIIGKHFTMEGGHLASTEGELISIGEDCMFSGDIEIRNGDSHSIIQNSTGKRLNWAKAVHIGDHVWLTAHVKVMKGSEIASNSIIGNSSVVTGKLETPHSIYTGNPAKFVKSDINWDRNRYKYTKNDK